MSDYLPTEVLAEIFSRLPVKSLIRFRSVSKSWKSIIASADFIDAHLTKSSNRPSLLLSRFYHDDSLIQHLNLHSYDGDDGVDDYVKLDCPLENPFQPHFVGACNGLFCLSDKGFDDEQTIVLWNPSIRRYVTLPPPRFTTNILSSYISFGFDLKTKDYKVVRLVYFDREKGTGQFSPPKAEVYALGARCWKSISSVYPSSGLAILLWEHVYINGACLRIELKQSPDGVFRLGLLSFDMGDEEFRAMDTPEEMNGGEFSLEVGLRLFQDKVSLYRFLKRENQTTLSIWVMREYGVTESWTKQYSFDFEGDLDGSMAESLYACYYVESLALVSGSSQDLQAPIHGGDLVLPTWLTRGAGRDGDEDADAGRTDANKNIGHSVTSILGNLLEFLLPV